MSNYINPIRKGVRAVPRVGGAERKEVESNGIVELSDEHREALNDLLLAGRDDFLFSHLFESYHDFVERIVQKEMRETEHLVHRVQENNLEYTSFLVFDNVMLRPALDRQTNDYLLPIDARTRKLNYSGDLIADVTQKLRVRNVLTNEVSERVVQEPERGMVITSIPIMVRSKYCVLKINPHVRSRECIYDRGGYFIVGGNEKVIISQERICDNKIMVFMKKTQAHGTTTLRAQVHSKKSDISLPQDIFVSAVADGTLVLSSNHFEKVPLYVFMRALGLQTDYDIQMACVGNPDDTEMANLLRRSYQQFRDARLEEKEEARPVQTQEDALLYILSEEKYLRHPIEVPEKDDPALRRKQRRARLVEIMTHLFIPHIDANLLAKAYYIGLMVRKLLTCQLGRRKMDDRDSHVNKRVDPPGVLLGQIFRQFFAKMLQEVRKFFRDKPQKPDDPVYVADRVAQNTISQSMNTALSTGTWPGNKGRSGIAQMLQRISYPSYLSFLRKINTPSPGEATNKLVSMREIHPAHYGFICPTESPDGATIGISKHLALSARITPNLTSQSELVRELLADSIVNHMELPASELHRYTPVMLNGSWIGVAADPDALLATFRDLRARNRVHRACSAVFLRAINEINIYTDSGRLYRPLLVVRDNELVITADALQAVADGRISSWTQLLLEHPGAIEYVDIEESEELMIARNVAEVLEHRRRMLTPVERPHRAGNPINRYNETMYVRYTHCEIDDLFQFGLLANSVPFADHNAAVRNIYNHGQQKQPQHQYCTNPHYRMDKTYMSYNSSRPLVHSRMMKYSNLDQMGYGEQTVVAVLCYTGGNQEDSLIGNQSAFELGHFKAMTYKVFEDRQNKNAATATNDEFRRPNRDDVSKMKQGNYDKLNEFGYVPVETHVGAEDVIIGKVSPTTEDAGGKRFRDASTVYQSSQVGVVDMFQQLTDEEGYKVYQMKIRSERMPVIGDKMASVCAQKGTIGLTLRRHKMPFTRDGIRPTLIINPNCVPSRMTIAMFLEQQLGKKCAIDAELGDGTPLNNRVDFEKVCDALEARGYHRYGYEEVYSGIDGKKMKALIMVSTQYYMRLRQMVDDKKHARATGPKQGLTRQPISGSTKLGFIRAGEMERDSMLGHGIATMLYERFMVTSDKHQVVICGKCGVYAVKVKSKQRAHRCPCGNTTDFNLVEMPYAFKLMIQELQAMHINTKLLCDETKYNDGMI